LQFLLPPTCPSQIGTHFQIQSPSRRQAIKSHNKVTVRNIERIIIFVGGVGKTSSLFTDSPCSSRCSLAIQSTITTSTDKPTHRIYFDTRNFPQQNNNTPKFKFFFNTSSHSLHTSTAIANLPHLQNQDNQQSQPCTPQSTSSPLARWVSHIQIRSKPSLFPPVLQSDSISRYL
jgi:hypothetical protein